MIMYQIDIDELRDELRSYYDAMTVEIDNGDSF